jgi:hypothetical protein
MKVLLLLALTVVAAEPVSLGVGETITIDELGLTLTFVDVPRDSRCPRDVQCIVAGEAHVVLDAERAGETTELTLKIPPGGQDQQSLEELTITITSLEPQTDSTRRIQASDYIATVVVTTEEDNP